MLTLNVRVRMRLNVLEPCTLRDTGQTSVVYIPVLHLTSLRRVETPVC